MKRQRLNDLIGLVAEKRRARIDIAACLALKEIFPHTLIYGRGGLGKTTFSRSVALELGYYFVEKEAAALKSRDDIVELLVGADETARSLGRPLLLFIDECHRLTVRQQEVFYFPMDEWKIDTGDDNWVNLRPFTLFGATTQRDKLDANSFVGRFSNKWELEPYAPIHMSQIVTGMLETHSLRASKKALEIIVGLCGGIPRKADRLVTKVRNYMIAHRRGVLVEEADLLQTLSIFGGIDSL